MERRVVESGSQEGVTRNEAGSAAKFEVACTQEKGEGAQEEWEEGKMRHKRGKQWRFLRRPSTPTGMDLTMM